MFPLLFESLCAHKVSLVQHFTRTRLYILWNDMYEIMCKHFKKKHYVRSKVSRVRSSHGLCARAHAHSLEGTMSLLMTPAVKFSLFVLMPENVSNRHKRRTTRML